MAEAEEEEGNRYRQTICCCIHFHAEDGARFIAMLGVIISALSILAFLVFFNRISVVGEVVHLLLCFGILHAQKVQNPNYYLPYIFAMILGTVILIAITALMLVVLVLTPNRKHYDEHWSVQYSGGTDERMTFFLATVGLIFAILFNIRIIRIVYLAYDYMKTKAFRHIPPHYNTV